MKLAVVAGAVLALGVVAVTPAWGYTIERQWRAALQAQIRGGAPKDRICDAAERYASVSQDGRFIEYALDIARRYCPAGTIGAKQPAPTGQPVRVNGVIVPVCSHGGLCHGRLMEALQRPVQW